MAKPTFGCSHHFAIHHQSQTLVTSKLLGDDGRWRGGGAFGVLGAVEHVVGVQGTSSVDILGMECGNSVFLFVEPSLAPFRSESVSESL